MNTWTKRLFLTPGAPMNTWTKRLFLSAVLTVPAAAWAASAAAGGSGSCVLGALFGCGG